MASILLVYATGEGQTARVAKRLAAGLENRGHEVTIQDIESAAIDVAAAGVDAVLVGSSIHLGTHHAEVRSWIADNVSTLNALPTGLVQVSLSSAGDDPDRRAEAAGYVDTLLEETGWTPDRIGLFGGALRYSKYGFLKRLMMKRIAAQAGHDTDTSRDHEYTDWAEVAAFANDFGAFIEGRLEAT